MLRVVRILAPNPGGFASSRARTPTSSARRPAIVVDPGPDDERHLRKWPGDRGGRVGACIVLTHDHPDHAPGASRLAGGDGCHRPRDAASGRGGNDCEEASVVASRTVWSSWSLPTPGHAPDHAAFWVPRKRGRCSPATRCSAAARASSTLPRAIRRVPPVAASGMRALAPRTIYPGHGPIVLRADASSTNTSSTGGARAAGVQRAGGRGPTDRGARVGDLRRVSEGGARVRLPFGARAPAEARRRGWRVEKRRPGQATPCGSAAEPAFVRTMRQAGQGPRLAAYRPTCSLVILQEGSTAEPGASAVGPHRAPGTARRVGTRKRPRPTTRTRPSSRRARQRSVRRLTRRAAQRRQVLLV